MTFDQGHQGHQGQISENVGNVLKHVEDKDFARKINITCIFWTILSKSVPVQDLEIFSDTQIAKI